MTTIIQSCVETQFIETTVKLKVASQKSLEFSPPSLEMKNKAKQGSASPAEFGGWSFLQALSNVSSNPREKMDKQNAYVHPLAKQYSSSRLSEKSLELCTENLGCETGSDIMDCNILSLSLSPPNSSSKMEKTTPIMQEQEQIPPPRLEYSYSDSNPNSNSYSSPKNSTTPKAMINNSSRKFPPPLTTLSNGTSSLQFRPHREEGRLVITAVEAPSKNPYFKADRSHGRLRLSFMDDTNYATKFDSQVSDVIQENDVDESEDDYEENVEENNDFNDDEEHYHHQLDDEDDDDDPDGENGASTSDKDMSGNIFEMEKFQRLINSRCNEGGHGHKGLCCNWEPLWVATS